MVENIICIACEGERANNTSITCFSLASHGFANLANGMVAVPWHHRIGCQSPQQSGVVGFARTEQRNRQFHCRRKARRRCPSSTKRNHLKALHTCCCILISNNAVHPGRTMPSGADNDNYKPRSSVRQSMTVQRAETLNK
jgi:hypothetical protein